MKYNSLDLPIIPKLDKTGFDFVYIAESLGVAYLTMADKLCFVEKSGGFTGNVMRRLDANGEYEYFNVYEWAIALTEEGREQMVEFYPGLNFSTWTLIAENENVNFVAVHRGPHWTNTDLYDQDGNLFLKASLPFCSRSFWLGVSLGLAGKGLPPIKTAEPVGYLYGHVAKEGETPTHTINGVDYVGAVLPDIYTVYTPELQKTHPYVGIYCCGNYFNQYSLLALPQDAYYDYDLAGDDSAFMFEGKPAYDSDIMIGETEWPQMELIRGGKSVGQIPVNQSGYRLIWTNFDVLNEDGSVHTATIDPIPIYE